MHESLVLRKTFRRLILSFSVAIESSFVIVRYCSPFVLILVSCSYCALAQWCLCWVSLVCQADIVVLQSPSITLWDGCASSSFAWEVFVRCIETWAGCMFYRPLPVLASLTVSLCRFLYRLCVFKSISFLRLVSFGFCYICRWTHCVCEVGWIQNLKAQMVVISLWGTAQSIRPRVLFTGQRNRQNTWSFLKSTSPLLGFLHWFLISCGLSLMVTQPGIAIPVDCTRLGAARTVSLSFCMSC